MTILYFTASWCIPCKTFGPVMDDIKEQLDIPVIKVDVDTNLGLTQKYEVRSVPSVVLCHLDGREVKRFSGAKDFNFVKSFIQSA
jgi:thioredoxin 1